ncbi:DNA-binding protein [Streptomyces calidiresistens]|uniref:Tetratricopeptide repeat protein n=1 Tax=Streptomyces calidiresistens TaxID=1485586 RepID=A0A7W3T0C0_9ACTN|nr:hypothetical protein [Streptomyces calidiresistens]MBB0228541.1 hypothetical protein [Streptomyces calidiresistens]
MPQTTVFPALLKERGWTDYHVFLREYEKTARHLATLQGPTNLRTATVSERQFRRWMAGELRGLPRGAARRILEYLFTMSIDRIFRLAEAPAKEVASQEETPSVLPSHVQQQDDVVSRAARESATWAAGVEQTNVGPHTLEQLEADIRRIVTSYPNRPVEPIFHEVTALRDRAFELLEGRQPPQYTRELYLMAGYLCGILANASFDLSRYDAGETQARVGFLCAELAGHNGLRAWLRGLQSLMAYWAGRPRDAVRLAEAGRDFTPERGTSHVRLESLAARAYGQMGMRSEALAAMHRAEELREIATDDDPGGMIAFPRAKELYCASSAMLWLGDDPSLRRAEQQAEEAVRLYEEPPPEERRLGELSLARLDLARARLGRGDLDGAADQVHVVLGLAHRRRIESVNRGLDLMARRIEASPAATSPAAIGMSEAITAHRLTRALPEAS